MKAKYIFALLLILSIKTPCFSAPLFSSKIAKIDFYIIEINRKIFTKSKIISDIKSLKRRSGPDGFKFISGGTFTVSPYISEEYRLLSNLCDLELMLSWKPKYYGDVIRYETSFDADVSYPFQNNASHISNNIEFKDGETVFLHTSKENNSDRDIRPVYAVITFKIEDTGFAFEQTGTIGVKLNVRSGFPAIKEVLKGSPAEIAGIKTDDEIRQVNGYSALQMSITDVSKLIKGKPQTEVDIKAYRPSTKEILDFKIKRTIISEDY